MVAVQVFRSEHAQGVVSVILPIQQLEFGIPIALAEQPDLLNIEGFYQVRNGNFWVASFGEEVVGTIGLLDIGGGRGALRKMFVKAAYRGAQQGVAVRLLQELLAWSSSRGLSEVYLGTTEKFLAAHRFYEKNGFVEVQRTALPEAFPVMHVDTKFYWVALARNAA